MENKPAFLNITVKGIIDIIFRNKMLIIITFIICIIISLIGIQFVTPVYDANVKMLVRGQGVVSSETYAPIMGSVHMTQAEIVKSYPVLKRVAIALELNNRSLDYEKNYCSELKKYYIDFQVKKIERELRELTPEKQEEMRLEMAIRDLRSRLSVELLPFTDIFVINIKAFSPEEAIETANVISRSYTMFDQIQQLAEVAMRYGEFHPTVLQLKDNIKFATENLSGKTLPDIEAIGTASVKIIEQASSDYAPVSKPKRIILLAALLASVGISFGFAIVLGLFNRKIKTPQEIVDYLDIPCIGSIPKKQLKDRYLINDSSQSTRYYEFYEELAEQIDVYLKTQSLKSALIVSPLYNKNHKYIVPNIGYFLSRIMSKKVLLIDFNLNNPNFVKIYSIKGSIGIGSSEIKKLSMDVVCKMDRGPDIIIAENSQKKIEIVLRDIDFKSFIDQYKNEYDLILIDASSINNTKDISAISDFCDGTIMIIDENKLRGQILKNTLPRIMHHDSKILGGILNNRTFPIPEFIYKNFKFFID